MSILDEYNEPKLNEGTVLICKPLEFPGYVVPGSIITECAECGKPILVAPSGQDIIKENPGTYVFCLFCGAKFWQQHPSHIEPPTPAQREEIREAHQDRRN
jgi:hypothetical protein